MSDVTRILSQIESGDPSAAAKLLPLVYDGLGKHAADKARLVELRYFAGLTGDQTAKIPGYFAHDGRPSLGLCPGPAAAGNSQLSPKLENNKKSVVLRTCSLRM